MAQTQSYRVPVQIHLLKLVTSASLLLQIDLSVAFTILLKSVRLHKSTDTDNQLLNLRSDIQLQVLL